MTLHHGDCLDVMAAMDPESVDAIVTDPPYGLEFMGKEWDRLDGEGWRTGGGFSKPGFGDRPTAWASFGTGDTANATCATCGGRMRGAKKCTCTEPDWRVKGKPLDSAGADSRVAQGRKMQQWHARWAEAAYRVAKPSAYLLAFGGTRTVHRMTVALEDAGWIIRDMLVWAYASGFPKSRASLKPAWEPVVMARKPGPLRMLAIDECRIPHVSDEDREATIVPQPNTGPPERVYNFGTGTGRNGETFDPRSGRWPANVVLTDPIFDGGWEGVVGGGEAGDFTKGRYALPDRKADGMFAGGRLDASNTYGDTGTYSRFFLIPKADRADREPVLGGLPEHDVPNYQPTVLVCDCGERWKPPENGGLLRCNHPRERYHYEAAPLNARKRANVHPTVKPTDLMRHLVRLVTPSGGTVLDPFLGSGTTAIAAEIEGFEWIGIEREAEYVAIAEARLNGTQRGLGLGA